MGVREGGYWWWEWEQGAARTSVITPSSTPNTQPCAGGRGWALNADPSLASSPLIEEWGGLPQSPPIPGTSTSRLFLTSNQEGKVDIFIRIWTPKCGEILAFSLQSFFLFLEVDGVPSDLVPVGAEPGQLVKVSQGVGG